MGAGGGDSASCQDLSSLSPASIGCFALPWRPTILVRQGESSLNCGVWCVVWSGGLSSAASLLPLSAASLSPGDPSFWGRGRGIRV